MNKFKSVVPTRGSRPAQHERIREMLAAKKRQGRPPGKRTHPDFEQVTAYIRKDTHHGVKLALLQEGKGRQFSELVEDLLAGWLKKLTT